MNWREFSPNIISFMRYMTKLPLLIAVPTTAGTGSETTLAAVITDAVTRHKYAINDFPLIPKYAVLDPRITLSLPPAAGTGSETTLAAVITDAVTRHKYAINDFPLIPKYAVLDPRITLSLPPALTATTGMDALTHAVEAYIGNSTTYGTRKNALMAIRLIFENLSTVYENGANIRARRNMLHAAYYADCAFTKSYVEYVHAVAHSLGGAYNVPHGLANAVLLPFVLESYGLKIHKKLHRLAVEVGLADEHDAPSVGARRFIEAIEDMKQRFSIGNTIPELQSEDIPRLARLADKEANPLYPVPVLKDAKELEEFYRLILSKEE